MKIAMPHFRQILTATAALLMLITPSWAEPVRVMLLGDSLTAQMEGRKALFDRLAAEGGGVEFVGSQSMGQFPGDHHEGHGGFTIGPDQSEPGNLFDNLDTWIPTARPDVIFLLVGNNDYNGKPGVDPASAPKRLATLIEKISKLAPQSTIIVGSVLKIAWVDDYAGELNRALPGIVEKQQAAGRKVVFADLHNEVELIKGEPPYNVPGGDYVDGTHLNASGGQKLADGWYAHLKPFLTNPQKQTNASGTNK